MAEREKLILRYSIRDEFTQDLSQTCNMKSRVCRGGSENLYRLILKSRAAPQYMKTDPDHLEIISGLGHTFIRYKDDTYNRYLYIDPTIAQFYPAFDGIFVGDEQDLRDIAAIQKNVKGYKLSLTDYLGPDYEGKKFPVPPLTVETNMMNRAKRARKTRKTRKNRRSQRR